MTILLVESSETDSEEIIAPRKGSEQLTGLVSGETILLDET
jgi:hypothetical protein